MPIEVCGKKLPCSLRLDRKQVPISRPAMEGDSGKYDCIPLRFLSDPSGLPNLALNRSENALYHSIYYGLPFSSSMRNIPLGVKQAHFDPRPALQPTWLFSHSGTTSVWIKENSQVNHDVHTQRSGAVTTWLSPSAPKAILIPSQHKVCGKDGAALKQRRRCKWSKVKKGSREPMEDADWAAFLCGCYHGTSESGALLRVYQQRPHKFLHPSLVITHLPCIDYKATDSEGVQLKPAAFDVPDVDQTEGKKVVCQQMNPTSKSDIQRSMKSASPQRRSVLMPQKSGEIRGSFRPDLNTSPPGATMECVPEVVRDRYGKERQLSITPVSTFDLCNDYLYRGSVDDNFNPSSLSHTASSDAEQSLNCRTLVICENRGNENLLQKFDTGVDSRAAALRYCLKLSAARNISNNTNCNIPGGYDEESEDLDRLRMKQLDETNDEKNRIAVNENVLEVPVRHSKDLKIGDNYEESEVLKNWSQNQSNEIFPLKSIVKFDELETKTRFADRLQSINNDSCSVQNHAIVSEGGDQSGNSNDEFSMYKTCTRNHFKNNKRGTGAAVSRQSDDSKLSSKTGVSLTLPTVLKLDHNQDTHLNIDDVSYTHIAGSNRKKPLSKILITAKDGETRGTLHKTNQFVGHKHLPCVTDSGCDQALCGASKLAGWQSEHNVREKWFALENAVQTAKGKPGAKSCEAVIPRSLHVSNNRPFPADQKSFVSNSQEKRPTTEMEKRSATGYIDRNLETNSHCVSKQKISDSHAAKSSRWKLMYSEAEIEKAGVEGYENKKEHGSGENKQKEITRETRDLLQKDTTNLRHSNVQNSVSVQEGPNEKPTTIKTRNYNHAAVEQMTASPTVRTVDKNAPNTNERITAKSKDTSTQGIPLLSRFERGVNETGDTIADKGNFFDTAKNKKLSLYVKHMPITNASVSATRSNLETNIPLPLDSQTATFSRLASSNKKNYVKINREQVSKSSFALNLDNATNSCIKKTKNLYDRARLLHRAVNTLKHDERIQGCIERLYKHKHFTNYSGKVLLQTNKTKLTPENEAPTQTETTNKETVEEPASDEFEEIEDYEWVSREVEEEDMKEGVSILERQLVKHLVPRKSSSPEAQTCGKRTKSPPRQPRQARQPIRLSRPCFRTREPTWAETLRANRLAVSCPTVDINFQAAFYAAQARLQELNLMPPRRKGRAAVTSPDALNAAVAQLSLPAKDSRRYLERLSPSYTERMESFYKHAQLDFIHDSQEACAEPLSDIGKFRGQVAYHPEALKPPILPEANVACFDEILAGIFSQRL